MASGGWAELCGLRQFLVGCGAWGLASFFSISDAAGLAAVSAKRPESDASLEFYCRYQRQRYLGTWGQIGLTISSSSMCGLIYTSSFFVSTARREPPGPRIVSRGVVLHFGFAAVPASCKANPCSSFP